MGLTKAENFDHEQNAIAGIARVLAHPARIAILQYLIEVKRCVGVEIVDEIPLAQPTISRHLKELKNAGLIKGQIDGNRVNYCIDPLGWERLRILFGQFVNLI